MGGGTATGGHHAVGVPTREQIEDLLRQVNDAENARPRTTVEATVAAIDETMADDVEGWANGRHSADRAAERIVERALFGLIRDYHREIELVIIDPPYVSFTWTMTGTVGRSDIAYGGCSVAEVNGQGKAQRYWYFNDPAQFPVSVRLRFAVRYLQAALLHRLGR